jgi:hypothetical protein
MKRSFTSYRSSSSEAAFTIFEEVFFVVFGSSRATWVESVFHSNLSAGLMNNLVV